MATVSNNRIRGRSTFTDRRGGVGISESGSAQPMAALCKITGGNSTQGFSVDIYANGKDKPVTGNGIIYATEMAISSVLPSGTWVIGHFTTIPVTGGSD